MGGLVKAARDAQYTAKQMGEAGKPLKALADRMEFVGDATKRLKERFFNMRYDVSRSVKELANRVQYNTGVIADVMGKNSKRGQKAMAENFRSAALNVKLMMNAGVISTKEGTKLIEGYMVKALQTMGFSKKEALMVRKGQDPYTGKAIGGKQNLTGKQRGGHITGGKPTGDSVPALLERGEYVLNSRAVSKVGRGALDRINFDAAPRFQAGGMVRIPGDPDTTGGRDKVAAGIANEVGSFIKRYGIQVNYAYDPGGGHQSPGHNVTGTALDVGPNTTGWPGVNKAVQAAAAAGKTVYYDGRFGSIALANHGEGNHAHIEWGSSGGVGGSAPGLELAPKLKRLMVDGPDSMLKATVQGALDVARGGANAVIGRANTLVSSATGDFSGADRAGFPVGGGGAARAIWNFMVDRGFSAAQAAGWLGVFQKESGFSTTVTNPSSGATGLAQWLGGRLTALKSKPNWSSLQTQLNFVWEELRGAESSAYNAIRGTSSPESAASVIDSMYERSDAILGATGYARSWFEKFGGGMKKGGPVGYAGDSLGVGTAPALQRLFGDDRNVQAAVSGGKSPEWGLGALKGLGKKKAHYVFDFGSNEYGGVGIMQALRQAKQYIGDKLLHTFTLNAGETEANKQIRGFGGASVIDWANKHGALGDGLHGDYGHRARLVADSIEKAAKTKQNKPKPHGKLKKRKHLSGLQAPGVNKLHNTVDALMHGDQAARLNALHGLLDHVHGTGLPGHVTDRIEGLTLQAEIAGDYADRLGQFTTEEGGAVFPGEIGGKTEIDFQQQQLDALFALRNRLIAAHEAIQARREQMKLLADTARKHLEFYAHAVTAWGHARKVMENRLEDLKKKPKKNKKEIESVRAQLKAIGADQDNRVRVRDTLKNRIIPALDAKRSGLKDYDTDTLMSGLTDVQGVGSPMTRMTELPALGVLGGSILTAQLNLARLKVPPTTTTDAMSDIASERDELLKEIGRLTLQRSAVEKLHEITLRDFPEFDRLGTPFGGKFHSGGIVPGPVGAEATTVLQGGEGVFTRDQMAAMGSPSVTINVAPGMEWLKQFISVEVGRTNRSVARNAGRGLPGQGGGRLPRWPRPSSWTRPRSRPAAPSSTSPRGSSPRASTGATAAITAYMAQAQRGELPVDYRIPNRTVTIPLSRPQRRRHHVRDRQEHDPGEGRAVPDRGRLVQTRRLVRRDRLPRRRQRHPASRRRLGAGVQGLRHRRQPDARGGPGLLRQRGRPGRQRRDHRRRC